MRIIPLVAAIAFGLAACDEATSVNSGSLTGTSWVAETINGKPVIEPGGVTLTFAPERVNGRSGCNTYFGAAEHGNGKLKISQVGATKMACLRDGLMQQENEFLNLLQASQTYTRPTEGRLILTSPNGTLVFDAAPAQ